jgi:hypothetical protein
MNVSQKTPLAPEREGRKNLRRWGHSNPFKIKCAFKAETDEHTPETPSHRISFSKSSALLRHSDPFPMMPSRKPSGSEGFLTETRQVFRHIFQWSFLWDTHQQWPKFFRVFESVSYLVFIVLWSSFSINIILSAGTRMSPLLLAPGQRSGVVLSTFYHLMFFQKNSQSLLHNEK